MEERRLAVPRCRHVEDNQIGVIDDVGVLELVKRGERRVGIQICVDGLVPARVELAGQVVKCGS